jgi:hypothetical protein
MRGTGGMRRTFFVDYNLLIVMWLAGEIVKLYTVRWIGVVVRRTSRLRGILNA